MPYPIKYIENNLVWNIEGECFAYYELIPFNYSFLSLEQKDAVHDAFRQLIAQNRDGKLFPVLRRAVRAVTNSEMRGLLRVIDALRDDGSENALAIADVYKRQGYC